MNNQDMEKCIWMATPLWECIGFGGFHIDFALVLSGSATGTEEENNLIKKIKSYGILFQ
jgi:hypothetical protein